MVHSFCENRPDCESHPSVQDIVSILERHFNNTAVIINETQVSEINLVVRTVRFIKFIETPLAVELSKCINNIKIKLNSYKLNKVTKFRNTVKYSNKMSEESLPMLPNIQALLAQ